MRDVWFAIPGNLETLTGGYIYARRLIEELRRAGWRLHVISLPSGFPRPAQTELDLTRQAFETLPEGAVVLVDGLAYGVFPQNILDGLNLNVVALVHHPLALESGLPDVEASRLCESEKAALKNARIVVTTGPDTARTLAAHYDIPSAKLFVALPGTDPASRSKGNGDIPRLLTVATLTYRKGHDVLVRALASVAELSWTSVWAGSMTREKNTTETIHSMIRFYGLEDRIELQGEVAGDALNDLYGQSDAFVLPSRHEGYGMAFAEALGHGLPIVACAAGAVPETVPADASFLVPADNPDALAAALRDLLSDAAKRKAMADAAWAHGQRLPRWSDTAEAVAQALSAASL